MERSFRPEFVMKRAPLLLLGCLLAAALLNGCGGGSASGPTGSGWTGFDPDNGKFTIAMPGKPVETTTTEPISTRWTTTADGVTYSVGYDKLTIPSGTADTDQAEQYMDNEEDTMRTLEGGKFLPDIKPLVVGGVPGREVDVEPEPNKLRRIRMCVSGDRLYKVEISGPKDKVGTADATQFLDSFRIAK
jgi:hypothetical protein